MSTGEFELARDDVQRLVEAGARAPSGGNVQPWRVIVRGNELELHLHAERSTSFIDVERFASVMAIGSFIENVSIAAASSGLEMSVLQTEYKGLEGPVARLRITRQNGVSSSSEAGLYPHMMGRSTNRKPHKGTAVQGTVIERLDHAATQAHRDCYLRTLDKESAKGELASVLAHADGFRFHNGRLRKQMFSELRWNPKEAEATRDGVDVATLEVPQQVVRQLKMVSGLGPVASLLPRSAIEQMTPPAIMSSSHVGCVCVRSGASASTMLAAGRALERVWVEATAAGLAVQPWNVLPFFMIRAEHYPNSGFTSKEDEEIRALGKDFRRILSIAPDETPAFVFRLSVSDPPSARALRLPWERYTDFAAAAKSG